MKFKKFGSILLASALLVTAFSAEASAAETSVSAPSQTAVTVSVNGAAVPADWQPIVENGTTLVPLRPLMNQLDVDLNWDGGTKTITGKKGDHQFTLRLGSSEAVVDGKATKLIAVPRAIRSVTYVPLRFIGEAAGYKVGWNASTSTVSLTSAAVKASPSIGFLWKTEHDGNTVYLLGSVHVANEQMYPLRPEIEKAFQSADYLGVEVDMTKVDADAMQKLLQETGVYADGTTLKDHVSADTYQKVVDILKARNLPSNSFDQYKPWVVAQTIPTLQAMDAGYQADLGIDVYLMQNAVKAGKPIVQFETAEGQLKMFDGFSASLQEQMLLGTIDEYNHPNEENGTSIEQITDMWAKGDEDALKELVKATAADSEYYKALLADRNPNMIEQIEGYLNGDEKKTYFVVVGALHMLGDDGIVTKLKSDGFTVEKE